MVSATLLCCDAWFDMTLSWGGRGQWSSLVAAALIELPTAAGLVWVSYRLLRRTSALAWHHLGGEGIPPPLRALPFNLPEPRTEDPEP